MLSLRGGLDWLKVCSTQRKAVLSTLGPAGINPAYTRRLVARLPAGRRRFWFLLLAPQARHETSERLQQQREHDGRQHIGLAKASRWKAAGIPELAQAKAKGAHGKARNIGSAATAQE